MDSKKSIYNERINQIPDRLVKFHPSKVSVKTTKVIKLTKPWINFGLSLLVALIFLFPFYLLLINSFKSNPDIASNKLGLPEKWEFSNYKDAISATNFWNAAWNSLVITIVSNLLILIFSAGGAWMIVRGKGIMSKATYVIYIFSLIIPFQVLMIPLVWWSELIGLTGMTGLIIIYLGFGVPLTTFLIHGFVKGLPISVEEAALIDGANVMKVFFRIILPMLKPILLTVLILNTIWLWNDFLLPWLILQDDSQYTIVLQIFSLNGSYGTDYALVMAALMLALIPAIIFFLFTQRGLIKGITSGANK